MDEINTLIHKFEFSKFERENDISTILSAFSWHINQRPIEFKVGGFYCLTKPFLATVREFVNNFKDFTKSVYIFFCFADHYWCFDLCYAINTILCTEIRDTYQTML